MVKTFNIPDEKVPELIEIFGEYYDEQIFDENGEFIPNPQTKAQFANTQFDNRIKNYIKDIVVSYRNNIAQQSVDNTNIIE